MLWRYIGRILLRLLLLAAFPSGGLPLHAYHHSISLHHPSILFITKSKSPQCHTSQHDSIRWQGFLASSSPQSDNNLLDMESPFSPSFIVDDDSDGLSPPLSALYGRDQDSLNNATEQFLHDQHTYPLGKLSEEDVETITGLMAAWGRRRSVTAALQVESLMKRIIDDMKAGNIDVHVRTQHYTLLLDAWSKSNAPGASERAQQIHDKMVEEYQATKNIDIRPSVLSCTTLASAWSRSNETHAPAMAEKVLRDMIAAYHRGETHLKPDAVTFSTVMEAYGKYKSSSVSGRDACQRCEELFALMDELGVRKNVYVFSALQNVYARSGLPHALNRTREILETMTKLYEAGDMFAKPNCRNYNAVLNAASRTGTLESAMLARDLLTQMETPKEMGGLDVDPDRVSYTLVILACSRIPDRALAAEMSLATLEQMERKAKEEEERRRLVSSAAPPVVRMDVECFNQVLTALSRAPNSRTSFRVGPLLRKMQKYAADGQPLISPNTRSWNTYLNSLARKRHRNGKIGVQAHGVLKHMFKLHNDGTPNVLPDAFSYAAVLTAYQRVATVAAAEAADQLVREMEELYESGVIDSPPDVYHYTILAGVWAKSEQGMVGANRAVQILAHMMDRHNAGFPNVKPNCRTFNAVLDCLSRADDGDRVENLLYHMLKLYKDGDESAKPDSFSFNCAISAFTRSKKKGSGRRAEAILDRFLEYQENENPRALPDVRSFTNIIAHYGRSRWQSGPGSKNLDSPYRAEYILNRMVALFKDGRKYLEPNVFAITTVIDSYSYAKHPDAGTNAERLLRLVETLREKYGATRLNITNTLLNSVLFAWASSGDPNAGNRAAVHVDYMEREYANGNQELRPDTRSYSLFLSAVSKSTGSEKAKTALDVMERMKKQIQQGNPDVAIDEHHYSLAINACAFSNADVESEAEAFKIAASLFDEVVISSVLEPSSLTYGWFLQACGRLRVSDAMKNPYIERAFCLCRDEGLVNDFVLRRLFGAASPELLDKLFSETGIDVARKQNQVKVSMLPPSWTSKAHRRHNTGKSGS